MLYRFSSEIIEPADSKNNFIQLHKYMFINKEYAFSEK